MTTPVPLIAGSGPTRRWLRGVFERIDDRYRASRELAPVGPLLYVGLERHTGAPEVFADGTRLEHGSWVGSLHFNNARAASVEARHRLQAGVRFGRLLRESFAELAERARTEPRYAAVPVYEGVTWLRAHGATAGFDAKPLPPGPRCWLLGAHFRLLLWAFAPVAPGRAMLEVRPHLFRITRASLIESFGSGRHARRAGRPVS